MPACMLLLQAAALFSTPQYTHAEANEGAASAASAEEGVPELHKVIGDGDNEAALQMIKTGADVNIKNAARF